MIEPCRLDVILMVNSISKKSFLDNIQHSSKEKYKC